MNVTPELFSMMPVIPDVKLLFGERLRGLYGYLDWRRFAFLLPVRRIFRLYHRSSTSCRAGSALTDQTIDHNLHFTPLREES